ncbi:unnamed protein product [Heterobilharzia americana]|nr:unnamed protein product [Heterobilharzia americana]
MQKQQNTNRENILLQGFHSIVRNETPVQMNNITITKNRLIEEFFTLDNLLDSKLNMDIILNENQFLPSELNEYEYWTIEWLQKHLDVLTEFGQILVKKSRTSSLHIVIEDILPITRLWNGYLQACSLSHLNHEFIYDDDTNGKMLKTHFYWDMYIVLKKPSQYQVRPYSLNEKPITYIPNYFYIAIPSINSEKTGLPGEILLETTKKQDTNDQYDLFRSCENFDFKNLSHHWNFISPQKICQSLFTTLVPEILDSSLFSEAGETGLKVISWRSLFGEDVDKATALGFYPIEVIFDSNTLGINPLYIHLKFGKVNKFNEVVL